MNRSEIIEGVIEILKEMQEEIQEGAGKSLVLDENSRPRFELNDFDSLCGVDATCRCLERFDIKDAGKIVTLFENTSKKGMHIAYSVGQIVDKILDLKKRMKGIFQ